MATARISSDTLSPDEVTRIASFQPLTAARRGEALINRTGRHPVIAKTASPIPSDCRPPAKSAFSAATASRHIGRNGVVTTSTGHFELSNQ